MGSRIPSNLEIHRLDDGLPKRIRIRCRLVNLAVGSNYMFLMRKPDTASLLDLLGPHPVYIFVEELIALTLFILMYIVFCHAGSH